MRARWLFAVAFVWILLASSVHGQGTAFTYQGELQDGGEPFSGNADLVFRLYTVPAGGVAVAVHNVGATPVTDGLFTAEVNFTSAPFTNAQVYYLEVQVNGQTLSPRQRLTPAPFSLATRGISATPVNDVGIGTNAPGAKLHVHDGAVTDQPIVTITNSLDASASIELGTGFYRWRIGQNRPPDQSLTDPFFIYDVIQGETRLLIEEISGDVGIGTNSPTSKLHVAGDIRSDNSVLVGNNLELDGATSSITSVAGLIDFANDDIITTGSVGIGTGTPDTRLQVRGDLTFQSTGDVSIGKAEIRTAGDMEFHKNFDANSNDGSWFRWFTDSDTIETMRVQSGNDALIAGDGTFTSNGLDFAEAFKAREADLEPGDVVSLAVGDWEYATRAPGAYDRHILGVVSTKPGFLCGTSFDAEDAADPALTAERQAVREQLQEAEQLHGRGAEGAPTFEVIIALREKERELTLAMQELVKQSHRPIALAGRVPCKVVGPIMAGDRITSSEVPGHAMKQTRPGMSVGVALEDFACEGEGTVIVLVQPGWHGGNEIGSMNDLLVQNEELESRVERLEALLSHALAGFEAESQ